MTHKAWKDHEKRTAKFFVGERFLRTNYSISQPDVKATLSHSCNLPGFTLVECKYSQDQNWHTYVLDNLDHPGTNIGITEDTLFWEINDTKDALQFLYTKSLQDCIVDTVHLIPFGRPIPGYLYKWLDQAESYLTVKGCEEWMEEGEPCLPLLSLGKKAKKRIVITCRFSKLVDYFNECDNN